jgi:hypothetical protein
MPRSPCAAPIPSLWPDPGPVLAGLHVVRQTSQAALSLTGFEVLPTGLLATLRTSTRDTGLLDVTYSFEALSAGEQTQLEVWAQTEQDENNTRVPANLARGSRGQDQGIDSRVYTLWFPVSLGEADKALTIHLSWPEAGIEHEAVTIEPADIRAALELAHLP